MATFNNGMNGDDNDDDNDNMGLTGVETNKLSTMTKTDDQPFNRISDDDDDDDDDDCNDEDGKSTMTSMSRHVSHMSTQTNSFPLNQLLASPSIEDQHGNQNNNNSSEHFVRVSQHVSQHSISVRYQDTTQLNLDEMIIQRQQHQQQEGKGTNQHDHFSTTEMSSSGPPECVDIISTTQTNDRDGLMDNGDINRPKENLKTRIVEYDGYGTMVNHSFHTSWKNHLGTEMMKQQHNESGRLMNGINDDSTMEASSTAMFENSSTLVGVTQLSMNDALQVADNNNNDDDREIESNKGEANDLADDLEKPLDQDTFAANNNVVSIPPMIRQSLRQSDLPEGTMTNMAVTGQDGDDEMDQVFEFTNVSQQVSVHSMTNLPYQQSTPRNAAAQLKAISTKTTMTDGENNTHDGNLSVDNSMEQSSAFVDVTQQVSNNHHNIAFPHQQTTQWSLTQVNSATGDVSINNAGYLGSPLPQCMTTMPNSNMTPKTPLDMSYNQQIQEKVLLMDQKATYAPRPVNDSKTMMAFQESLHSPTTPQSNNEGSSKTIHRSSTAAGTIVGPTQLPTRQLMEHHIAKLDLRDEHEDNDDNDDDNNNGAVDNTESEEQSSSLLSWNNNGRSNTRGRRIPHSSVLPAMPTLS